KVIRRAEIWWRGPRSNEPHSLAMMPYERVRAWQACDQLVVAVYRATMVFPRHELYGLTSQARRAGGQCGCEHCGRVREARPTRVPALPGYRPRIALRAIVHLAAVPEARVLIG